MSIQDEAEISLYRIANEVNDLTALVERGADLSPAAVGDIATQLLALELTLRKRNQPRRVA